MSLDVTTLALAKSYTDKQGGGSSGASTAENVSYTNAVEGWNNVKQALDGLTNYLDAYGEEIADLGTNSHTHNNKTVLDKLSDLNGKLQYNGSDVGLKGDKGDTPVKGTDYWTAADKQEIVNDVLAALPTWTGGSY